ncbi:MAG: hypothetical protein KTU85_01755 [Acidimicrobiia bacterium]|nr:hypothetical protein [Acidimicrobiia bacterium]MCY4458591.1 hypothetical protein [Acidimicrobiaceae bacterium]
MGGASSSISDLERFVSNHGAEAIPNLSDLDNSVWEFYDVTSQQTFALINDDGATEIAKVSVPELATRIETLVAT